MMIKLGEKSSLCSGCGGWGMSTINCDLSMLVEVGVVEVELGLEGN